MTSACRGHTKEVNVDVVKEQLITEEQEKYVEQQDVAQQEDEISGFPGGIETLINTIFIVLTPSPSFLTEQNTFSFHFTDSIGESFSFLHYSSLCSGEDDDGHRRRKQRGGAMVETSTATAMMGGSVDDGGALWCEGEGEIGGVVVVRCEGEREIGGNIAERSWQGDIEKVCGMGPVREFQLKFKRISNPCKRPNSPECFPFFCLPKDLRH
ncbi:hypothetical protein LR48_Vigan10g230100 [Vigna angularis]|uniref:Uncharacterized protein n=1 Tax=Phaseolus angularis TaxID=3914 RepID=A0A0L9VNT8_PHAAN|nr:hypothetical protein LR48_Vigan10g230100 [Vigna angularis]